MAKSQTDFDITIESLPEILENDTKVKVAGVDIDGILRGKLMAKKKFLGIAEKGFGFCSVIFGWDMHDQTYFKELKISNKENGYRDIIAIPDLGSFRRIPWEDNVPFFLLSFFDPETYEPLSACPRGLLKSAAEEMEERGMTAMAGGIVSHCASRAGCALADHEVSCEKLNTSSTNSVCRMPRLQHPQNAIHQPPLSS